jgi:flagellar hook-length control protein FliK
VHHVASDTKAAAGRLVPPHSPRAADRAPSQPFASLLDDPPAAPPPSHAAKHDDTARTDSPQTGHRANDSKTNKPPQKAANDNNVKAPAGSDTPGKAADSAKSASDAKTGKCKDGTDACDPAKPADDGKTPTDASKSDASAADDSCGPLPTTAGAAADIGVAVTTPPQDQAPQPQGAAVGGCGPDPTLPEIAALEVANGQSSDATKSQDAKSDDAAKTQDAELPTDADGKPQTAANGADKPVPANSKGDASPPAHHANAEPPPVQTGDPGGAATAKAANGNQPLTLAPPPGHATAPTTPAANQAALAQPAAVPLAGVAIEIAGKALAGKNRFEIRLDPPELGRIDVRLDVDRNGHVTSHLTVDRPETLNLLRQDSASLQRALQDAGLKTADNGLQFSLRDQSMGRDQSQSPLPGSAQLVVEDDALAATASTQHRHSRIAGMGSGVDIRV